MKLVSRICLLICLLAIQEYALIAQSIDMSKVAYELFEYSISSIDENLPQDMGSMTMDRVTISENACDYYYTIKDNTEFTEYRNNKSQVKKNLYIYFDQNLTSLESTLMFCIDANVSINYHYKNRIGSEVVIPFSVSELKDILGKDYITTSYRQEVLKRWLPIAFSAAAESPMTYQGMTESSILYTLMLNNDSWDEGATMDQSYMVKMVREAFEHNEPGRFFPLICIYAEKGEDLTVVNSKTGARKSGAISFFWLSNVYKSTHSAKRSYTIEEMPPLPDDDEEEESIPFQLVETKPMFNGGDANAFSEWVNTQLVYPKKARDNGIQGRVTLQFSVAADGSVKNVRVLRGVDPLLDAEAVRVVKKSPKWKPGMQNGKPVIVTYTFPVIFALN